MSSIYPLSLLLAIYKKRRPSSRASCNEERGLFSGEERLAHGRFNAGNPLL